MAKKASDTFLTARPLVIPAGAKAHRGPHQINFASPHLVIDVAIDKDTTASVYFSEGETTRAGYIVDPAAEDDPGLLLEALDALALALVDHGHHWTDRESMLYERAAARAKERSR